MNIEHLTVGEIAAIEKYSGRPISSFENESSYDTRTMCAVGVVIARRLGLKADVEDIEQLTLDELTTLMNQVIPPSRSDKGEKAAAIAEYLEAHPADPDIAGE